MSKLLSALKNGDTISALAIVQQGAIVANETDDEAKWTPLHFAAQLGSVELTTALLKAGANIDAQTSQGFSPLYIATKQQKLEVLKVLISMGANPNLKDGHHQTALHRACEMNLSVLANAIITSTGKSGTNTTSTTSTNSSATSSAPREGVLDVNLQDLMGRTPLHWAAEKGMVTTVDLLLQNGAKLIKSSGGEDPLLWASRAGHLDVIILILQFSPYTNVLEPNDRNVSAVDLAKTQDIRDFLRAHALSCGYTHDESKRIQNIEQGVSVKIHQSPSTSTKVATATSTTTAAPGGAKKLTIKLKPKDPPKQ
jgi:ankyrin repeat protein